ncbi:MAG: hypothetical protein D6762_01995, partial [Candidatus Neomarinimicrobiota bacterium]
GYWIVLLVLYLLSGLLKKRQQQAARRRLEAVEEGPAEEPKPPPEPDWLKNLFQEFVEPEVSVAPVRESEPEPPPTVEPPSPSPEPEETGPEPLNVLEHLKEEKPPAEPLPVGSGRAAEIRSWLTSPEGLRQAVLLREILDRPRAYRRTIR